MPLFPCINTSTIRPVALSEKLDLIARVGFRHVELWNDEIDQHKKVTGESLIQVHNRLSDLGLSVPSVVAMMNWADAPSEELPKVLEECRRRAEQAAAVGSVSIIASPPKGFVSINDFCDRFEMVREIAEREGLKTYLEFLGFTQQYHTLDSVLSCSRRYPAGRVPIVADSFHLIRGGGSLEDLQKLTSPAELGIFHINDLPSDPPFANQTDHDRVMLGEGVIDLKKVVRLLVDSGYEGCVSLELFNQDLWQSDPESVLRTGYQRLSELLYSS
ncbi:MAG: hypothetical protein RJA81_1259 [Planctomycetota bacterium]|jgi:sugar phosphate isomerase/epimerase